ncbi:uncharacterized protein LOC132333192 [Haemorhous mexicanus]|uniref:uncharacterized protein LOC132333192 n=1 Tax=Haemorhous mexicanus TaxID=30427 RepID=UPI0028BF09DC|nr:uncharacterized protein LOC132333192 [Haemorhous mexicanus]
MGYWRSGPAWVIAPCGGFSAQGRRGGNPKKQRPPLALVSFPQYATKEGSVVLCSVCGTAVHALRLAPPLSSGRPADSVLWERACESSGRPWPPLKNSSAPRLHQPRPGRWESLCLFVCPVSTTSTWHKSVSKDLLHGYQTRFMRKVICKHWHLRLDWPKHDQSSVISKFKYGIIPKEKIQVKKKLLYHYCTILHFIHKQS